MWMYSPETYLFGLWQATACRNEHSLLMLELDLQPRSFCRLWQATVCRDELTTERRFPNECCSVDYNETETVTYVPTDRHVFTAWSGCILQRLTCVDCDKQQPAKSSWQLNPAMCCNVMYSPVTDFCGLCQGSACREELTAEPYWTLMSPVNDWMWNTAK